MRIFKIFAKNGQITYEQLRKIFTLLEFNLTDTEFKLMVRFADETNDGMISSFEFAN
jgi:Ca2+-binding EF-hand superfamily protein